MQRPDKPLSVLGVLADDEAISSFLRRVNDSYGRLKIGSLDAVREIVYAHQDILLTRGATLGQLTGARILYRPAIPASSTKSDTVGSYDTTLIEITCKNRNWYLTGAAQVRLPAGTPEAVSYVLPAPAIDAIAARALAGISLDPSSKTPDLNRLLSGTREGFGMDAAA
jgi:hypothetical protein